MVEIGTLIDGKYRLTRFIGQGGMGEVYEGVHLKIGRRVAVKLLQGDLLQVDEDVVARFRREAMAAGRIETQHIVELIDTGVDPARQLPYLVMELLAGSDLEALIERCGVLAPDLVLRVATQTLLGLKKAHAAGVIHRDIKSANLFLATRDVGEVVLKIVDFGIAKMRGDALGAGASATRSGMLLGSVDYLSPEQATGEPDIDPRADLWSVGVVMYEALTGRTPHAEFEALGRKLIAICQQPARPVRDLAPWVPVEVAAIVEQALRIRREDRFANADQMLDAILELLEDGWDIRESMLQPLSAQARALNPPPKPGRGKERLAAEVLNVAQASLALQPVVTASQPPLQAAERIIDHLEDIYAFLGRWEPLIALYSTHLDRCESASERRSLTIRLAGVYARQLDDPSEAIERLVKLLLADPEDEEIANEVIAIAGERRRWRHVVTAMDRGLASEDDPTRVARLCVRIGLFNIAAGAPQKADEYLLRAMRAAPDNAVLLRHAADIYEGLGAWDDARRALMRALDATTVANERAAVYHHLGEIHETQLGDAQSARSCYKNARREDPTFAPANEALLRLG